MEAGVVTFGWRPTTAVGSGNGKDGEAPRRRISRHESRSRIRGHNARKLLGGYYPVAALGDKSAFERGGWRACFED
jgi:hypothetical protein